MKNLPREEKATYVGCSHSYRVCLRVFHRLSTVPRLATSSFSGCTTLDKIATAMLCDLRVTVTGEREDQRSLGLCLGPPARVCPYYSLTKRACGWVNNTLSIIPADGLLMRFGIGGSRLEGLW